MVSSIERFHCTYTGQPAGFEWFPLYRGSTVHANVHTEHFCHNVSNLGANMHSPTKYNLQVCISEQITRVQRRSVPTIARGDTKIPQFKGTQRSTFMSCFPFSTLSRRYVHIPMSLDSNLFTVVCLCTLAMMRCMHALQAIPTLYRVWRGKCHRKDTERTSSIVKGSMRIIPSTNCALVWKRTQRTEFPFSVGLVVRYIYCRSGCSLNLVSVWLFAIFSVGVVVRYI